MKERINKISKKIFKSKKIVLFFVLFLTAGVFIAGNPVHADGVGAAVGVLLGTIIYPFVAVVGMLVTLMLKLLVDVFQYNDFINAVPVVTGWVIIRDTCNMFFILILLVIAFATILRIDGYDLKKMIPKLIIMAVLINFSRTICGLILDAANLIMNTFVNAFKDNAASTMLDMLGMNKILSMQVAEDAKATGTAVAGSLILALVFSLISLVVIVVLLAVLIVRMVMIWIYVVLSPLAYLLATFPQGKDYASKWWSTFTQNVISGPILAFFIWLAFTAVNSDNVTSQVLLTQGDGITMDPTVGVSAFGTTDTMLKYLISIGMLLGGLAVTQEMGGQIGKIAGAGMSKIQAGGNFVKKKAVDVGKRTALGAGHMALATGKMVDRLPALAMGNTKEGMAVAQHGVFGGALGAAKNLPGMAKDFISKRIDQNYDINKTRVSAVGKDGKLKETIKHSDGFDYKLNKNSAGKDIYQRYDKEKKTYIGDVNDKKYTLNKKNVFGKEEAVGAMSSVESNFHAAVWSAGSVARAARFEAEDKSVEDTKKKIVRFDDTQLHALLDSITSSKIEKRAAAEQLAERGKFNDLSEVNKARSLYGTNGKALGDFNDKVNIKQAHKAYDFENDKDIERFHGDIAKGKVDVVKFDLDELAKPAPFKAFESFYGDDTSDQLKKIGNRASSKKDKEKVGRVFSAATKLHMDESLVAAKQAKDFESVGDTAGAEAAGKKAVEQKKLTTKMRKEHLKFSGNAEEVFKIDMGGDKYDIDIDAVADTVKTFKPKDYDEVGVENIDKLIEAYGKLGAGKEDEIKRVIADNMSVSALQKLAGNGEKEELTKRLGEIILGSGSDAKKDAVKADNKLRAILELAVLPKKPKGKGKKKTGSVDAQVNPTSSDAKPEPEEEKA